MDFSALQQGVMTAIVAVAGVTFSIPPAAPQDEVSLTHPEISSSYNLPKETAETESIQNLNSLMTPITDELKMVVKEAKASEIITVEQPPAVFTVSEPTPKPSPSAKSSSEPENESEANAKASEKSGTKDVEKKKEESNPSPSASATPSPVPSPAAIALTSANAAQLFQMTNDHRAKIGKPAFEKDDRLCKIAEGRAPQVKGELASGALHKGFKALNLPYWATENIAAYATMKENFNFLITDYIHKKAIESDNKYSCTACSGTSCSQVFSSFVAK